jgi:hypothetical protein
VSPTEGGEPREHLELAHHHPGRLRVRADSLIEAPEVFEAIEEALAGLPGIAKVTYTAQTGSILVEYEPGLAEPDTIIVLIAETAGLEPPLDEEELRRRRAQPALLAIGAAREINNLTMEITGHRADLRTIGPAAIAGLAVYSFMNETDKKMPRWDNLLYWSFNIFMMLHRRELDAAAPAPART